MPNELKIGRVYRHFKGDFYLVEAVANDSETGEPFVVYRKLYGDGGLWLRPLAMFLSPVDRAKYPDAAQEYRFELQELRLIGIALCKAIVNALQVFIRQHNRILLFP